MIVTTFGSDFQLLPWLSNTSSTQFHVVFFFLFLLPTESSDDAHMHMGVGHL